MNEFKKTQDSETAKKIEKGGRCQLCTDILAQPKKRQNDFYDAMLDESITIVTIHDVLGRWNILSSKTTIQNHRQGTAGYAVHMDRLKKVLGR